MRLGFPPPNRPRSTSFSVHFPLSAACEPWRRNPGSISPGWILGERLVRIRRIVSCPYPGKSPLPASRPAAKPPSGTTYSRPRKKPSAGRCRCPHRQGQCSCRPHSNSTPGVAGWPPTSSAPVSCGKGNRPACAPRAAVACTNFLSCVPPFPCCRSTRKGFLPHSCGVFRRWHAPRSFGTSCPEVTSGQSAQKSGSLRCFPGRGIPFRTVILFSRCSSSMNYPKSTRKKCNSRNLARIAF